MTDKNTVKQQLKRIGADVRFWGRSEANELPKILFPGEQIMHALNGRYERGFALFCATDQRLLLLDKKPLILCFEDMRYEMVSEVDYTEEILTATLKLQTPGRTLRFRSFRINRLRNLTSFIQEEVSRFRHAGHEEQYPHPVNRQPQFYNEYLQDSTSPTASVNGVHQQPASYMSYPTNPYRQQQLQARRRVPKFTTSPPAEPSKM
jgi:hypothetical protein